MNIKCCTLISPTGLGTAVRRIVVLVDVAIEHNESLSSQFPGLRKEDRHGFTLVLTAWRHAARDSGECEETEMVCPNTDGGAHRDTSHCIWQKMYCDGHQVRPACCIITQIIDSD